MVQRVIDRHLHRPASRHHDGDADVRDGIGLEDVLADPRREMRHLPGPSDGVRAGRQRRSASPRHGNRGRSREQEHEGRKHQTGPARHRHLIHTPAHAARSLLAEERERLARGTADRRLLAGAQRGAGDDVGRPRVDVRQPGRVQCRHTDGHAALRPPHFPRLVIGECQGPRPADRAAAHLQHRSLRALPGTRSQGRPEQERGAHEKDPARTASDPMAEHQNTRSMRQARLHPRGSSQLKLSKWGPKPQRVYTLPGGSPLAVRSEPEMVPRRDVLRSVTQWGTGGAPPQRPWIGPAPGMGRTAGPPMVRPVTGSGDAPFFFGGAEGARRPEGATGRSTRQLTLHGSLPVQRSRRLDALQHPVRTRGESATGPPGHRPAPPPAHPDSARR